MTAITLYTITDPRTGKPFYVGISGKMMNRERAHNSLDCVSTRQIIREIHENGLWPIFDYVASFSERWRAIRAETALMRKLHSDGFVLRNLGYRSEPPLPD